MFAHLGSKKRKISGMENEEGTKSQSRKWSSKLKPNGPRGDKKKGVFHKAWGFISLSRTGDEA